MPWSLLNSLMKIINVKCASNRVMIVTEWQELYKIEKKPTSNCSKEWCCIKDSFYCSRRFMAGILPIWRKIQTKHFITINGPELRWYLLWLQTCSTVGLWGYPSLPCSLYFMVYKITDTVFFIDWSVAIIWLKYWW